MAVTVVGVVMCVQGRVVTSVRWAEPEWKKGLSQQEGAGEGPVLQRPLRDRYTLGVVGQYWLV